MKLRKFIAREGLILLGWMALLFIILEVEFAMEIAMLTVIIVYPICWILKFIKRVKHLKRIKIKSGSGDTQLR